MDIQGYNVSSTVATGRSATTVSNTSSEMSNDTFYKLLAAQLQNQDPMESMDNTQMILQMAQFATIEQLNNMNDQFAYFMEMSTFQSGASMVGKEVTVGAEDADGKATTVTGTVTKVGFTSSGPILEIDGEYYELWRVITITEPSTSNPDGTPEVLPGDGTEDVMAVKVPGDKAQDDVEGSSNSEEVAQIEKSSLIEG